MTGLAAASRRSTLAALLLAAASVSPAQGPPTVPATVAPAPARRDWPPPLDRVVALYARDVSLREALDRLAAAAKLRFSYSSEALPLDHSVRVAAESAAVGDLLAELLRGIAVTPVIAGPEQVVLAPVRTLARSDTARLTTPRTLDRVVVTGRAVGGPERPLTVAVNVVRGSDLERGGVSTMAQAMDFAVPGIWLWNQSPSGLVASYGSIRGASSFGVSYPKVYIDGIEVANPLLLTQLVPESIDRIEVIRGPQGAALYGADAISGVVNILLRHDGSDGEHGARLRSVAGVSQSDFVSRAVPSQEHTLALRTGTSVRSAGLDLAIGSLGAFYEGASSRHVTASAATRVIGARTIFSGTARLFAKEAGASTNPLLAGLVTNSGPGGGGGDANDPQSVKQYTFGGTLQVTANERWTHSFVAGVDGYRLANVAQAFVPFPSSTDSALRAARGGADRMTVRASSVAQLATSDAASASLTLAAEHTILRESIPVGTSYDPHHSGPGDRGRTAVDWLTGTGLTAQSEIALQRTVYLTGGLRLERSDAFTGTVQYSLLPMIGTAVVRDYGDLSLKLRVAYGKGIRAPRTASRETMFGGLRMPTSLSALAPEEQAGVEGGFDVYIGRAFSVQLTRFDQRVSGLIQQVPFTLTSAPPGGGSSEPRPRVVFELQNVGAIRNRGWEMQGLARRGPFTLSTAVALVDSRVLRVATGYTGDLRAGDRVFDVPSQTLSVVASWASGPWSADVGAIRAFNWNDYDRLALGRFLATSDRPASDLFGSPLRDYWRQYDGVTRVRTSISRSLGRGVGLVLTGENLLGEQRGEPDNVTILPGRTVMLGLRAAF